MYRRILVGTDNSVESAATVEFAAQLAHDVGAHLHVAATHRTYHASPHTMSCFDGLTSIREAGEAQAMESHRVHLELLAQRLRRRGIDVSTHVVAGDPAHRLSDLATDLGADLVIIGGGERLRSRRGRRRRFGNVAGSVVRAVMVPVLVVPTASGSAGVVL
jgi:nucleotide-binding universal stress UspA family protein